MDNTAGESQEQYLERMSQIVGYGYAALGIAIGSELGLFHAMATLNRPVTAAELARQADCKERYVREWLLQMAMAKVITMDEAGQVFHYPKERVEGFVKATSFSALLPHITTTHEDLLKAFRTDGPRGVGGENPRVLLKFQDARKPFEYADVGVRNTDALQDRLNAGGNVLEIGSGSGKVLLKVAKHYPRTTFYGVDIDADDVADATAAAQQAGAKNVVFRVEDGANLPPEWSSKFEAVSLFDTLHDIPHASKTCQEIFRVLKPGGYCFVGETKGPSDPKRQFEENPNGSCVMYSLSLYHCISQSLTVEGSEALGPGFGQENMVALLEKPGLKFVSATTIPPERLVSKVLLTLVKPE